MAHVLAGPRGSPPLGPGGFDWTTWQADPSIVTGLAALGVGYLVVTLQQRRIDPETRVEPAKVVSFIGALLVLFGALTGPIHDLSDYYLFSAHMVQHMLLIFAMPPLLLYGVPGFMVSPLLRNPGIVRLGCRLTRPTSAFAIFNVTLVAWHVPPLYNLAMNHHPVHIIEHLMIMAAAVVL